MHGQTDVLRDIHRGAIPALDDLLVQPIGREIDPDAAVFLLEEDTFL